MRDRKRGREDDMLLSLRLLKPGNMDDYYEMVLEAAGRTGRNPHSLPPSKRRKGSYADDDRADAGMKLSASQVPSKKTLDPIERDRIPFD
ncbi:hypothetical protein QVD17_37828 [Tagetes erecta]|uniref:Uncharacterized protein n=1 Tax=Tagetes erecta TaxID=13708 RepID=A0AAD8JZ25_TARER|nr:hypothetical protein QVD17_37828 [Tagetes erecta]